MIPTLLLSIVIAVGGQNAQPEPPWAKAVLASKRAKSLSRRQTGMEAANSGHNQQMAKVGQRIVSADPLIDPVRDWEYKQIYHGIRMIDYTVQTGDLDKALLDYGALETRYELTDRVYLDIKISLEYLAGYRAEAYADEVGEFRDPHGDRNWLLLAVVSAANGQIFPGQLEYCESAVADSQDWRTAYFRELPEWNTLSARDVEAAACLANAVCGDRVLDKRFLARALKLAPTCAAIASQLAGRYSVALQYSKARTLDKQMLSRLSKPEERKWFSDDLRYSEGKADVPPTKPVFDDGGA